MFENSKYLKFFRVEIKALREKSAALLIQYYESKNHQKRQLQTGGFQELKRDLQAVLSTRTNINIAQIEDYGGETFLSEELAIAILQKSKIALRRCSVLSQPMDLPTNATQILETTLQYLINEHVDYALELGLQCVPIAEGRSQPQIYFFTVVRQCNVIIRLLEEQFSGELLPLILSTPKHADCMNKKKCTLEQIEIKIDTGLDRSINAIVGWVRNYLQTEQRKTDFKPETEMVDTLNTQACLTVCQYVSGMIKHIKERMDGKSLENVLTELGIRFHRVVYEHLQQFQFNSAGAMCAICDMNEYRKCVKQLNAPLVTTLFDTLHALCNLLLVKPENLKQVCSGDQLVSIFAGQYIINCDKITKLCFQAILDRTILSTFIQLRTDYKTQKLAYSLKGFAT